MTSWTPPVSLGLKAAGFIGTWNTDVPAGRTVLDADAAAVLTGDAGLAGEPLSLERALSRLHPDDHDWVFERIRQVRASGGTFAAEFRVLTGAGEVRWLLNRGTLAPNQAGIMKGYGAYTDITDSRRGPALTASVASPSGNDPLLTAADLSLEANAAIRLTGHPRLQQLSEGLLMEFGYVLGQRLRP